MVFFRDCMWVVELEEKQQRKTTVLSRADLATVLTLPWGVRYPFLSLLVRMLLCVTPEEVKNCGHGLFGILCGRCAPSFINSFISMN